MSEEKYMDGACGKCGSEDVYFNYFEPGSNGTGFQEFLCNECGAITKQTFNYVITGQEIVYEPGDDE